MRKDELEKIYRLYYKDLYIYGFSVCKDHYLTEELISDSFYKAFISLEDYKGSFKGGFMSFKEIFLKYQKGIATEEEKKLVEEELEKNDIINEYLSEKLFSREAGNNHNDFINDGKVEIVKKKIDKKLSKIVFKSIVITLAIIAMGKFIVTPTFNSYFYNPNGKGNYKESEAIGEFFVKVSVFTNLHFPGYITNFGTEAIPRGYGVYDININQHNRFNNDKKINGRLIRNKFFSEDENLFLFPSVGIFYDKENNFGFSNENSRGQSEKDLNFYREELKKLPETALVSAFISFKEDLDLEQLEKVKEDININWVAIRGMERSSAIGFEPQGVGPVIDKGKYDEEKYPFLELANSEENEIFNKEKLETHLKSQLKYMRDSEEFLNSIFKINDISKIYYSDQLEYIEKNGVKSYGILVTGTTKEMLELTEKEYFNSIFVDDVKLSMLEK
ncbi:MAG: anti sigma factor C-terminal domain-containing protein [Sarcina sp.]